MTSLLRIAFMWCLLIWTTSPSLAASVPEASLPGELVQSSGSIHVANMHEYLLGFLQHEQVEQQLGRKLKWSEKLGLKAFRAKLAKYLRKNPSAFSPVSWDACFRLTMRNGQELDVQVLQIAPNEIKYRRCGYANDPEVIVSKREVAFLRDANGELLFANADGKWKPQGGKSGQIDTLALVGGILGISGLVFLFIVPLLGLILSLGGIITGAIGLGNIRRNPELEGRGWGITGIVGGGLAILFFLVLIIAYASGW